jgi:GT2 family glycosyltransferase
MLRSRSPKIKIIENTKNLGLTKAYNQALRGAESRYALLLDSDTIVQPGAVDELFRFLESSPSAGVAAPRLLNVDGTDQRTARSFPSAANALFGRQTLLTKLFPRNRWSRRYLRPDGWGQQLPYQVDWISFACTLFRTELLNRVGFFDEDYFVYWIDADWCKRVVDAGYEVFCVPKARVVHVETNRRGRKRAPRSIVDFHRGSYLFYRKHCVKGAWNPMTLAAMLGLGLRCVSLLFVNQLRRG